MPVIVAYGLDGVDSDALRVFKIRTLPNIVAEIEVLGISPQHVRVRTPVELAPDTVNDLREINVFIDALTTRPERIPEVLADVCRVVASAFTEFAKTNLPGDTCIIEVVTRSQALTEGLVIRSIEIW